MSRDGGAWADGVTWWGLDGYDAVYGLYLPSIGDGSDNAATIGERRVNNNSVSRSPDPRDNTYAADVAVTDTGAHYKKDGLGSWADAC